MAVMEILIAPDPRLKEIAAPVEAVTSDICQLMDDMLETMYHARGVGLAAPQVGVLKRVLVADVSYHDENIGPKPYKLINPEIVWSSEEMYTYEEGCLSLPEIWEERERPKKIRVKCLNEKGEPWEFEAEDLLAFCIQHEIDHLDGTLLVDYLGRVKRDMALKKLKKMKKQGKLAQTKQTPEKVEAF